MISSRRGFLKLLGAAAAVPVVAKVGAGPVEAAAELMLPAGSVIEPLSTATSIGDAVGKAVAGGPSSAAVAGRLGDDHGWDFVDEWEWRERYRQRVREQIEREEYEKITFIANARTISGRDGFGRSWALPDHSIGLASSYELYGPVIAQRAVPYWLDTRLLDEVPPVRSRRAGPEEQARSLATLPPGVAHVVADAIADQVRQDVLAQLLTLQSEYRR